MAYGGAAHCEWLRLALRLLKCCRPTFSAGPLAGLRRNAGCRPGVDALPPEVRALLQEHQDHRKAALDQRRRAVYSEVGDEVLLDTTHTPLPSRDKLSPRWMGPFKILAKTAPNTYWLAVPAAWRAFNEFNVDRLRRYHRRPLAAGR